MIDIKPFCWYTDFDPEKRRFADEPSEIIEDGIVLTDPDLIKEVWHPLFRSEDIVLLSTEAESFIKDVSKQAPEKPDYWSSCGQCDRNIDRAEEILEQAKKDKKE